MPRQAQEFQQSLWGEQIPNDLQGQRQDLQNALRSGEASVRPGRGSPCLLQASSSAMPPLPRTTTVAELSPAASHDATASPDLPFVLRIKKDEAPVARELR